MRIDVVTTFPEVFGDGAGAVLSASIPGRARRAGLVEWHATNPRDYAGNKHQKTDDRPFGGGPGMVMACQPVWDAVHAAEALDPRPATRLFMTPAGAPLTQRVVEELAGRERLLVLAGHYEGVDERVVEALEMREVSVGDYVLSGGELAAMVLIDAVVRLLPGALGDGESAQSDSFGVAGSYVGVAGTPKSERVEVAEGTRLLDCPHYTKPRVWMGREVPAVLLSGDHGAIAKWRLEQRILRTKARRGVGGL
jgi:tRNA (guanine37-N1)-methyltransferase